VSNFQLVPLKVISSVAQIVNAVQKNQQNDNMSGSREAKTKQPKVEQKRIESNIFKTFCCLLSLH